LLASATATAPRAPRAPRARTAAIVIFAKVVIAYLLVRLLFEARRPDEDPGEDSFRSE
jgi:hypothetical protein